MGRSVITFLLLSFLTSRPCVAQNIGPAVRPSIEDYATIEAWCNGAPVYNFGFTSIYGMPPLLLPGARMQKNNNNPIEHITLKKSWEITTNLCGSTPAREPKTMWDDDQPLLPIHLIDGDPATVWSSRGGNDASGDRPEWIRIDLPAPTTIASVALVCSQVAPSGYDHVGKVLPKALTIRLSTNAHNWNTVYENEVFSGPDSGPTVIKFAPQPAKQIWILGGDLQQVGNWGKAMSIGEVEVRDTKGTNLALVSRGANVQVSSTYYGYGMDRFTQDMLWPIQYDLGFKWLRVGYDMGMFTWAYVEREKGKLQVDQRADEAITQAVHNGVNVIMCLDKGNWLYHNPPRKVDWKKARTREMMETYYDHQGWPTDSPKLMAGYLRYVNYMVRHFKNRVAYYEIGNEWQGIGISNYIRLVNATIPVIKKADPRARIMLGSVGGFDRGAILECLSGGGSQIEKGRFIVLGPTVAVAKGVREKNLTVSVDARSDEEAGILLRFKDRKNFLLADYAPQNNSIYFHEVVDGNYGPFLARKDVEGFGPTVHLVAKVEGSAVSLSASDGKKTVVTTYQDQHVRNTGGVGLFHNIGLRQEFADLRVYDQTGSPVFLDQFQNVVEESSKWILAEGYWNGTVGKVEVSRLDAIGWHPFYQADPGPRDHSIFPRYRKDVEELKQACAALGFKGQYAATEWTWAAPYPPPTSGFVCSEMQKAKYCAQLITAQCGMGLISLYNETFQSGRIDWDCTLLRNSSFQVDPITPPQPQPAYYVLRNLSTALDNFLTAPFPVEFNPRKTYECYTFKHGTNELQVAAWIPGRTGDSLREEQTDVILPGIECKEAWGIDIMNGAKQELQVTHSGGNSVLKDVLIKDYPVLLRLVQ